jgi:peptide/nickel transport system permease protein
MKAVSFLLRRAAFYAVTAVAAVVINFVLPRLMPGDPGTALVARFRGRLAPETLASLQVAFGVSDAPLVEQFWRWLVDLSHGDLGVSLSAYPQPVVDVIAGALPWTLWMAGTALVVSFVVGTALGVVAAWYRDGLLDRLLPGALTWVGAFPYFWVAMLLLDVLAFQLGWFPRGYATSEGQAAEFSWAFAVDVVRHAILPISTIVVASVGGWMVAMRNVMVTVLGTDMITLARAKGISTRRMMWAYAARNALVPQVTGFGMALGFVVGGSLLTEVVFAYPGQGYLLVQAVRAQDYPLLQGIFLVLTLAVLSANFFVDLVVVWLDPRTPEGR